MVGTIVNEYLSGRAFTPGQRIQYNGMAVDVSDNGKVYLTADQSANVDFVSVTDSNNKVSTDLYLPGTSNLEPITCIPLVPGMVLNLKLSATNAAISIGDQIECAGSGLFDKYTSGTSTIIGIALEAKDALDGAESSVKKNYVKTLIKRS